MTSNTLLKVNELSCQRGDKQLFSDITFSVHEEQCWHIIGSYGSGKTSMLRQIAGLLDGGQKPQSDAVQWLSHTTDPEASPAPCFAYLGHSDGLKPELTALENLEFYNGFYSTTYAYETAQRSSSVDLDEYLHRVGILDCADLLTKSLSFGQRRRLSLARVLLSQQPVWMLDEPLTGIDVRGRELFISLFEEHLRTQGAILLTHHQGLADSRLSPYLQELVIASATNNAMSMDAS